MFKIIHKPRALHHRPELHTLGRSSPPKPELHTTGRSSPPQIGALPL